MVEVLQGLAETLQDGVDLLDGDVGVQRRLCQFADPFRAGPDRSVTSVCHDASMTTPRAELAVPRRRDCSHGGKVREGSAATAV